MSNTGQAKGTRLLWASLSGALLASSFFPQLGFPWAAWVAPGLMLWATRSSRMKGVLCAGFCAGLGFCLISFYWLLLIPFFWYGVAAWLGLSAVLSVYIAAWCAVCWLFFPQWNNPRIEARGLVEVWHGLAWWRRAGWALFCAAAWVAMEMAAGRVVTDYPLISLGASQYRLLPLIQAASFIGVYGVSFLAGWFSVCLCGAALSLRGTRPARGVVIQLLPPLAMIGCVLVLGEQRVSAAKPASGRLKIALVQPSFPERVIWDPKEETNRFLKLMEMSRTALLEKPDLLVWPEAALPEIIGRNRYTQEAIGNLVRPARVWMVMGLVDIRPRAGAESAGKFDAFNSAFLVDPDGELAGVYDKTHLLVFGEFMPWWARMIPFAGRLRLAAEITPGGAPRAFEMKEPRARFGVSICYEDCFPEEMRARAEGETDFILNLTNDGWFGESAAQWQHAASALFRAVENGVPLVRCCNNGLTCWIDAEGRMHDVYFPGSKNIYDAGYKIVEVPLAGKCSNHERTFYNRHGDWFGWCCCGAVLIGLATRAGGRLIQARRTTAASRKGAC